MLETFERRAFNADKTGDVTSSQPFVLRRSSQPDRVRAGDGRIGVFGVARGPEKGVQARKTRASLGLPSRRKRALEAAPFGDPVEFASSLRRPRCRTGCIGQQDGSSASGGGGGGSSGAGE